jgi:hypothetical protein
MRTGFNNLYVIPLCWLAMFAAAGGAVLATNAFAQSARDVRGASPYVAIENEPAPKLIVDPPLPAGLAQGIFWASRRFVANRAKLAKIANAKRT